MKDLLMNRSITNEGIWIGRCHVPPERAYNNIEGPHVIWVHKEWVYDLSHYFKSTGELINSINYKEILNVKDPNITKVGAFEEILENSFYHQKNDAKPFLLSPNDTQAVKACGVTFIKSLLERVIEERAKGEPQLAIQLRDEITAVIGESLNNIVPGSKQAISLKDELKKRGIWSQYLEVGIGPNAEVFTKSQPFSSVGFGAEVGVLSDSKWNNPEPEIVLVVTNSGKIVGATLGNDVNLRDYEGRSALLLGEAKDQNGSCAVGPLFRLFDDSFSLEDVKSAKVSLTITGSDGFELKDASDMGEISRSPEELVKQVINENHQYPDGFVLFCGTMFAPTLDRNEKDMGFTHKPQDRVIIESPKLGTLVNWVNSADKIPNWNFGINAFVDYSLKRLQKKN
ncbi:fumarylacetoacetate hydrolase family protein [Muricauda oceani]|uniref:Fumarylacetoacetate hydrolase n=1 Tax=Flagellimonas oceani TaxID=2698672 RepID=A0A6G7J4M7_9FLAO|nr:fumarylacetoacetate hydrolase family protein [Allomuricauda oceani]MBW8242698.1 fumarylacetoacetate hydrolase family protein [Allomuricauda oceani]QII45559.1 fumarylacetoacetate hydrolase [Allomuricauda oceani]